MKFRNLTPHPLTIVDENGTHIPFPVDGPAPRLAVVREPLGLLDGFPVVRPTLGAPEGLPAPEPNVFLIVSALIAEHPSLADRTDLLYPGEPIRDASGKVIAARGLCAGPGFADDEGGGGDE